MLVVFDRLGVGIRIEQLFGFFGEVGRLDDEDPAFAIGILVDRLGLVAALTATTSPDTGE